MSVQWLARYFSTHTDRKMSCYFCIQITFHDNNVSISQNNYHCHSRKTRMTTSISSEAQKIKSWMVIRTSRFKVYLLIDLLEKINTKPCFILYNDDGQSKLHKRCS